MMMVNIILKQTDNLQKINSISSLETSRLAKLIQSFRIQWYSWLFLVLCYQWFNFSHPVTHLANLLWYLLAHFSPRCEKGKRLLVCDYFPGRGLTGCLSREALGDPRLSLPNRTAVGTSTAVAATFSQNSSPDRLRNPICPSMPSTANTSSFPLRGLCEISYPVSCHTDNWIRSQLKAKKSQKLYSLFSWESSYIVITMFLPFLSNPKHGTGNVLWPQMDTLKKVPLEHSFAHSSQQGLWVWGLADGVIMKCLAQWVPSLLSPLWWGAVLYAKTYILGCWNIYVHIFQTQQFVCVCALWVQLGWCTWHL